MGTPFGKFELIRKLATGGMAEIWLARQTGMQGFEKPVVIKRILQHLGSDENFVKMFLDEGRMAACLNHQNIVQIYDLGCVDGQYFIAMEYVDGVDVSTVLKQGRTKKMPLKLRFTLRIVSQACEGLHYAHFLKNMNGLSMNLVHRDVSPQNILISYNGTVKITDFGIAKARGRSTTTTTGTLKGKFGYMSPEQIAGKEIDNRSDVFSLGIVLWEMLTYRRLFKKDNEAATIMAVANDEIPSPKRYWPNLPSELEQITMKALERNVTLRYQSARDLGNDLEKYLLSQGFGVVPSEIAQFLDAVFPEKNVSERDHSSISGVSAAAYRDASSTSKSLPMVTSPGFRPPQASEEAPGEMATTVLDPSSSHSPAEPPSATHPPVPTDEKPYQDLSQAMRSVLDAAESRDVEDADIEVMGEKAPAAEEVFFTPPKPVVPPDHRPSAAIKAIFVVAPLVLIGLSVGAYFAFFNAGSLRPVAPEPVLNQAGATPGTPSPLAAASKTVEAAKKEEPAAPTDEPAEAAKEGPASASKAAAKKEEKKPKETQVAARPSENNPKEAEPPPEKRPGPPGEKPPVKQATAPAEAAAVGDGFLNLDSDPWAEVWTGGTKLGDTPIVKIKVPAGTLQLMLKNPELGFEKRISVTVTANETTTKKIAVKKGSLSVKTEPQSEVYIARNKVGDTPLNGYEIFEGSYKLRLVNKDMGLEKVVSVTINPGQAMTVSETLAK